jgi:hypothetical protein
MVIFLTHFLLTPRTQKFPIPLLRYAAHPSKPPAYGSKLKHRSLFPANGNHFRAPLQHSCTGCSTDGSRYGISRLTRPVQDGCGFTKKYWYAPGLLSGPRDNFFKCVAPFFYFDPENMKIQLTNPKRQWNTLWAVLLFFVVHLTSALAQHATATIHFDQ